MSTKLDIFNKNQTQKEIPDIRPGDVVRVQIKLGEQTKRGAERTQTFEGLVIAKKHGKGISSTFTVRKVSEGIGVERIFPIFSPSIIKVEIVRRSKVRRAKLYYMRERAGKKARMKNKEALGIEWFSETNKTKEVPPAGGIPTEVGKVKTEKTASEKKSAA
jgi:large subunit ribosomal protein L19